MGFWSRHFPITAAALIRLKRARQDLKMLEHLRKAGDLADSTGNAKARGLIDRAILAYPDSTNKNGS